MQPSILPSKLHVRTIIIVLSLVWLCDGRQRSAADLWRIPWTLQDSTFHNLGNPLIDSLCALDNYHNGQQSSVTRYDVINCSSTLSHRWEHNCHPSTRNGPSASTIIVEPHVIAVEGKTESAGVFVMNAMFPVLHKLGYHPQARYWSELLNQYFDAEAAEAATQSSLQWDDYVEHGGENPFADIENYMLFQSEAGQHLIANIRDIVDTNDSPYGRTLQWTIGLHMMSDNERYAQGMKDAHCVGANFFLAEGLRCTSAGVLSCPMFPFHLAESLAVTSATRGALKQNVVLVDNDAVHVFQPARLQQELRALGLHDAQVLVHTGRTREEVPELYVRTKITLDCGNGGVEFINYEAALYDVLTLSCSSRATRNAFDFPVPSAYLLEPQRWEQMVGRIHRLLVDYDDHVQAFGAFKQLVRTSQARIETQMDVHLFARDVVFRTWCRTYSECRHVILWAAAVWTLHPLSRIEVYTSVPTAEFLLDNDVAVQLLRRQFAAQYLHLAQYEAEGAHRGLHPADFFAQWPCSHVVYLSPQAVLFGRDMLNTHMWALERRPRTTPAHIVHATVEGIVLAVTQDRLFARLVKVQGIPDVYLEISRTLRRVENYDIYAMLRARGVNEFRQVPSSYVEERAVGAVLDMQAAVELLAPLPRTTTLPAEPLILDLLLIPEAAQANGDRDATAGTCSGTRDVSEGGVGNDNEDDEASAECTPATAGQPVLGNDPFYPALPAPHFWLTSTSPLLPVQRVLSCLSAKQLERVVQHLDPIIQNALMQRALGVIPIAVREVFGLFDAINFPNVVSLLDSRHQNWG